MPTSAQVTVTTTASILVAATAFDQTVYLHNLAGGGGGGGGGGNAVYIGDANVTAANGYKLDNGDKLTLMVGDHEALYGITASSTQTVAVLKQIN
jgi:hypothetical protein